MLFLYWRKCHFLSYSYNRCLIKDPTERLKIYAYFENSQTGSRGPFDSPESWVHHDICSAILGPVLGAIWKQRNWPGQQEKKKVSHVYFMKYSMMGPLQMPNIMSSDRSRPCLWVENMIFCHNKYDANQFRYVVQGRMQLSSWSKIGKLFCLSKGLLRVAVKSNALFS